MNAIAAVSPSWGIGKAGGLLFHIKADMQRFRAMTTGGTVLMGRRTLDSLPGGNPLPHRRNIVLTRDAAFHREGVETAHSVEEALELVRGEDPEKVWVIGGGEIYAALLPYCSRCAITRVYEERESDAFFPNLDAMPEWRVFRSEAILLEGDTAYQFMEYIRREP